MNKLITLLRLRQEGFQTEAFEDDFIMDVPEELIRCFGPHKALKYCEKKFREAAQATIVGPNCEKIISGTCNDYNWGDFTLHTTQDILHTVGLSRVSDYDGPLTKDMICPRYIVEVNQDEVLFPDMLDGTLIIRITGEDAIRIESASVNFATGAVIVEPQDERIVSENLYDLFIDFGNGVEHKVAANEEQRDDTDGLHFYFDEIMRLNF